jgi:hypothetical protein
MGYYLLKLSLPASPSAIPSMYQSENVCSVGYRIGYKLLYNIPEEMELCIRGLAIIIKSGKHKAEVLSYDKRHNKYVVGIEITPGILLKVDDIPPSLLSRLP